jgi:hypothetical protein
MHGSACEGQRAVLDLKRVRLCTVWMFAYTCPVVRRVPHLLPLPLTARPGSELVQETGTEQMRERGMIDDPRRGTTCPTTGQVSTDQYMRPSGSCGTSPASRRWSRSSSAEPTVAHRAGETLLRGRQFGRFMRTVVSKLGWRSRSAPLTHHRLVLATI